MNKRFSLGIKGKLTILMSVSIFFFVFIAMAMLILAGKEKKEAELQAKLITSIENNAEKIRFRNKFIQLDKSYIVRDNIYTSLYNEKHDFIYGETPANFLFFDDFTPNTLKKSDQFYIYDIIKEIKGQKILVRGIMSMETTKQTFSSLFYLVLMLLPIIALSTIVLARLVIRKTFKPIEHILTIADTIQNSKDLSLRIRLDSMVNDEIHALAHTFDKMFDRLEQAFLKEKQFTSDASHEIRTPISIIIAQCELALERELARKAQDQKNIEAIKTVLWNAKKISQMTSQLLLLTKAEHYTDILEHETIDFSELCEIIAEQQQELAEEKNLSLTFDIEKNLWCVGDSTLLTSALLNLFTNAMKYNKENGKIHFQLSHKDNNIYGTISDTGIGIAESDLPKIWERFFQVDKARSRKQQEYSGMGLGLPLVRWIIEAHEGTIDVISQPNHGTIFSFTLPQKNTA